MADRVVVFAGERKVFEGSRLEAALEIRRLEGGSEACPQFQVFELSSGRPLDIDTSGGDSEIGLRYGVSEVSVSIQGEVVRKPGRPRLGVVAREVTLLPRHWDWLSKQKGGASAALRALVDAAARESSDSLKKSSARDAAYSFMTHLAGDRIGYEEAIRALYANNRIAFLDRISEWPEDIRELILRTSEEAFS